MSFTGGCGRPECCASTGIHEGITFGTGKLDNDGYWEYPCAICARAWEKMHPEEAPCWPFEKEEEEDYCEVCDGPCQGH